MLCSNHVRQREKRLEISSVCRRTLDGTTWDRGRRGIIADDFTFENIRRVAGAIASYVLKYEDPKRGVIVGYDARFASPQAARVVADIISAAGIPVKLATDYTPTSAVSYGVKHQ